MRCGDSRLYHNGNIKGLPARIASNGSHLRTVALVILALFIVHPLPAPHRERVLVTVESEKCILRIEADDESRTLRLRILPENSGCYCSKDEMLSILQSALTRGNDPKVDDPYKSLFLGRLIDYPWLSEYLASAAYRDPAWDKKRGKPLSKGMNKYVGDLLARKEITDTLGQAIAGSGFRITSASVEKVLVGRFGDVPKYTGRILAGKVPFDAMVWFRLERR